MLDGTTYIWSEDGNISVEYLVDTKSYVDGIDLSGYATKADTVLETTLSRGRGNGSKIGEYSVAFGSNVIAAGSASHAEGRGTAAIGDRSHAEGGGDILKAKLTGEANATSYVSNRFLPIGAVCFSVASSGDHPIVIDSQDNNGEYTIILNETLDPDNPLENKNTTFLLSVAKGYNSHIEGTNSIAIGNFQHVEGTNNIPLADKLQIIGNGTGSTVNTRSNAYALDIAGNGYYEGDVYVGCNADSTGGTKLAKITDIPEEIFTVNFTTSNLQTATADQTVADIMAANSAGKVLRGTIQLAPGMDVSMIGVIYATNIVFSAYVADAMFVVFGKVVNNADVWAIYTPINLSASGPTADYSAKNLKITDVKAPTANTDAANKKYVDDAVAGVNVPVQDVQINGTSIIENNSANIPVATIAETQEIITEYDEGDEGMVVEMTFVSAGGGVAYYESVSNVSDIATAYKSGKNVVFHFPAQTGYCPYDVYESMSSYIPEKIDGNSVLHQEMIYLSFGDNSYQSDSLPFGTVSIVNNKLRVSIYID